MVKAFENKRNQKSLFGLFRVARFEFRVCFELKYQEPETNTKPETRNTKQIK